MNINLSKLEREKRPDPFVVTLSDDETEVTFVDPKKLHFTTLAGLDDLSQLQRLAVLTGDGYKALADDSAMDGEAIQLIMEAWYTHYGLGSPGEAPSS